MCRGEPKFCPQHNEVLSMATLTKRAARVTVDEPTQFLEATWSIWIVATLSTLSSAAGIVAFFDPPTLRTLAFAALASMMMGMLSALTWRWGLSALSKVPHLRQCLPVLAALAVASFVIGAVSIPTNITGLTANSSQALMEKEMIADRRDAASRSGLLDSRYTVLDDRLAVWATHFGDVASREASGAGRTGAAGCFQVCRANQEAQALVERHRTQIAKKREDLSALKAKITDALLALQEKPQEPLQGNDEAVEARMPARGDQDIVTRLAVLDDLLQRTARLDAIASLDSVQAEARRWAPSAGAHDQVQVVDSDLEALADELEGLRASIRGPRNADLMEPLSTFGRVVRYAPESPVLVVVGILLDFLPWILVVFVLAGKAVRIESEERPQSLAEEARSHVSEVLALKAALDRISDRTTRGKRS